MALGIPVSYVTQAAKSAGIGAPKSSAGLMPAGSWETIGPYGAATRDVGLAGNAPASAPWSIQSYQAANRTSPGWATLQGALAARAPKTAEAYGTPFKSEQQITQENDPVLQLLRAQLGQYDSQNALARQQASAAQQQAQALAAWNRQQIQAQYGTDSRLLQNEQYRNIDLANALAQQLFGIQQEHYGATYDDLQRQLDQAGTARHSFAENQRAINRLNLQGRDLTIDELRKLFDIDQSAYNNALNYLGQQEGFANTEYSQGTQYSTALVDFLNRQYNQGLGYSNELRDYIGKQFQLAQDTSKEQDEQARRKAKSEAISRGAMSSTGYGLTRQDLLDQLSLAFRGNALERDKNLGGVAERDRGLALNRDKGLTDVEQRNKELATNRDKLLAQLANQRLGARDDLNRAYHQSLAGQERAKLQYNQQLNDVNYNIRKSNEAYNQTSGDIGYRWGELARQQQAEADAYDNQQQVFESMAQDYGIRQSDLQRVMQQGINRIGLDFNQTMQQIAQDYASGDANRRAQAAALQSQILQYGK